MSSPDKSDVRNYLLRTNFPLGGFRVAVPASRADRVEAWASPRRGQHADRLTLCFPETGIVSQVAITDDNRRLEVGIYGREGFGPASMVAGVDRTPYEHFVQVEGAGFLVAAAGFVEAFGQSRTLNALLLRYMQVFAVQTGYTALSNGSGVIGERLARWLLMCHDRIDGNELVLTHEFLGIMLGVRRSGVTDAIHHLEGVGIIHAVSRPDRDPRPRAPRRDGGRQLRRSRDRICASSRADCVNSLK